jgi:predicted HTH transcriptional regulator
MDREPPPRHSECESNLTEGRAAVEAYVSALGQLTFDQQPVRDATLDDLNPEKPDAYLAHLRQTRPRAASLKGPREEALTRLHDVRLVDGVLRPTLAGLRLFGKYPQELEAQLVISYLQFYGTTETEKAPAASVSWTTASSRGRSPR